MTERQIVVGCTVPVVRADNADIRLVGEILMIRHAENGQEQAEFYVHYDGYNKRLDEWVRYSRLVLSDMKFPRNKGKKTVIPGATPGAKDAAKGTPQSASRSAAGGRKSGVSKSAKGKGKGKGTVDSKGRKKKKGSSLREPLTPGLNVGSLEDVVMKDAEGATPANDDMDLDAPGAGADASAPSKQSAESGKANSSNDPSGPSKAEPGNEEEGEGAPAVFSKEKEIEKLRTSGSMTQSVAEISRVKNINKIIMGKHEVETWYFSPYPEEFSALDCIYICEFCLEPYGSLRQFDRHRIKCMMKHPPGNEIYRKEGLSFFEIDGRKQKKYCRNLCLLSKLFLDHKTLFYDVDPFLFYIMARCDTYGSHVVGYFSKEKQSAEEYNVACILTLPQHQRMGYGKLLIAFSYELSKIEKKTGSPEKPLSDLGLLSYRSFWADTILEKLYKYRGEITVAELSEETSITPDDIMHTLHTLDLLKYYRGQHIICISQKNIEQLEKNLKKAKIKIDPAYLDWTPPKFQPHHLKFL